MDTEIPVLRQIYDELYNGMDSSGNGHIRANSENLYQANKERAAGRG